MALAFTRLTGGNQATATLSFTTASIAPDPNALLLISIYTNITGASSATAADPTVTGFGQTWTQLARSQQPSNDRHQYFYSVQLGATPGSGTISVSWGGVANFPGSWSVIQVTGHRTTNPVPQAVAAQGTLSAGFQTPAPTLAAPVNTDSRSIAASGVRANNPARTLNANWTVDDQVATVLWVTAHDGVAWDAGPFITLTGGLSVQYCSIALEIAAAAAAVTQLNGSDTGHATDAGTVTFKAFNGADTAHATDNGAVTFKGFTKADTAHATDSGAVTFKAFADADTAHAVDGGALSATAHTAADAAATADTGAVTFAAFTGSEAATAADDAAVVSTETFTALAADDSATVTEDAQLAALLSGADGGSTTDRAPQLALTATDSSGVTESGEVSTPPAAFAGTDAGQATEAAALASVVTDADVAHVAETADVITTPNDGSVPRPVAASGPTRPALLGVARPALLGAARPRRTAP